MGSPHAYASGVPTHCGPIEKLVLVCRARRNVCRLVVGDEDRARGRCVVDAVSIDGRHDVFWPTQEATGILA